MAHRPGFLTFDPIFTDNLWGGRRLPVFLNRPAPHDRAIGEAWVLSDVPGQLSVVATGPFAGRSLRDLLTEFPTAILGPGAQPGDRFPLLLKFIDARQELSVQVHPDDRLAAQLEGPQHRGKTEAWVILEADPDRSRIYAGFRVGQTPETFKQAMATGQVPDTLHSFTPTPGECVFLRAGTVHAIGAHILLFEVQQTSNITYRLYDWDRVDPITHKPRELHIEKGLACSNFAAGPCPAIPASRTGDLVECEYFTLRRHTIDQPQRLDSSTVCRVLIGVAGRGTLVADDERQTLGPGQVVLVSAALGDCEVVPEEPMTVLECGPGLA